MNSFGRLFRVSIYGESHGSSVGAIIDGVVPGIDLCEEDFIQDLSRRKADKKGTTPRKESDLPIIESGVFNGKTTGAPILIRFLNENIRSKDYSNLVTTPRPGHCDYTARVKYKGYNDYRGGGHFSGRLTLGIVAAGVIAKKILGGANISSKIVSLHGNSDPNQFELELDKAISMHDSIGGVVEIKINGIPKGLGEPYFDSVESCLSHLIFSVGGVKGLEFGIGFEGQHLYGSQFNDAFIDENGKTETNNNGGVNGGITNGNEIMLRVFVKPTPSVGVKQKTFNFSSGKLEDLIITGRHDSAIILRIAPVLEAMCAIGLCDLYLINKSYK